MTLNTKHHASRLTPQLPSISIASLEAVTAVAMAGTMSGAAQRLGRTQSAVSQLVSHAEEIFGCALFDRSRRPFLTTPAGSDLIRHASRILVDLDALPQRMAERNQASSLRIAMIDSVADTLGADLIRLTAVRGGDLFVSQGLSPAHVNDLLERRLDIVVSADSFDEHDGLFRLPIMSEKFVLLLPDRSTKFSPNISLVELAANLPFIRYSSRSTTGAMIEKYLRKLGVPGVRRIEVDNADMMCTLVAQGVGWAITTPLHILQGFQRMKGVAVVTLPDSSPERVVTIITRHGEFEEIAATLGLEAKKLLREKYLPELYARIPKLAQEIQVMD
ncbi:MAG: LysR family transcriptional regulator [Sheuella sp.]|nr:LysR family transcriptional regulator [Sheuella sp.]